MNVKEKLRDSLVSRIRSLSADKLIEVNNLLNKVEDDLKSKEKTLKLAGTWSDLGDDLISDLTENLHTKRANDR